MENEQPVRVGLFNVADWPLVWSACVLLLSKHDEHWLVVFGQVCLLVEETSPTKIIMTMKPRLSHVQERAGEGRTPSEKRTAAERNLG